jgi:uncharacterized membrane protein
MTITRLPVAGPPSASSTDSGLDGWKVGTALAGFAGIASFQQSLLPRTHVQQAGVTVASMALAFGVGVGANAIANKIDKETGLDALGARAVMAGAGGLAVLGTTLALRGRPNYALEGIRTATGVLGAGAVVGAALIGEQALVDNIEDDVPGGAAGAHAAIIGAAALGTAAWVFGHARPGAMTKEQEAAYIAATGGAQGTSRNLVAYDPERFARLTQLRNEMTTVSGKVAGTRLPDGTVGTSGFRFINEATPKSEIAAVMGADPATVKDPIRVYGGMRHGATREELAQKIFDEAMDLGAFERRHIMLYLPSGTGHENPIPVAATEYLTLGDVASIGMQYNNKPSTMSLHKMGEATDLFERVHQKFLDHIATLPADRRPQVIRYGESLGGISLLKAFEGKGPAAVSNGANNKLISVGTPGFSSFRRAAVGGGYRLDATRTIYDFDHLEQLASLAPEDRAGVSTFLLTHYNDPVARAHPSTLFMRPSWLGDTDQAMGIPRKMKYIPGVTGVQSIIDTMNGTKVVPGLLERTGHDYRADLAPVMANILDVNASEEQLRGISYGLNQLELARVNGSLPAPHFPAGIIGN